MKKFKVNFGPKGSSTNRNCYECGIEEFDESRFYTKKDIKDIGNLEVGETWIDPDKDLTDIHHKQKSNLRCRRLE